MIGEQLDLLDLLAQAEETAAAGPGRHVLLPNMAYACGGSILTKAGGFTFAPAYWDEVTCPECKALDLDELVALQRRMQSNQAASA